MVDDHVAPRPYLSLASGVGGLDLAIRGALPGARCVCYVENDLAAACVLAARFADGALDPAPIWSDLHTFDPGPWRGLVEGVVGGYPCQPFSIAGRKRGESDPRHLWPAIERCLVALQPRWCFFENVAHHLRLGGREVIRDLHGLGYRTAATLFTAEEIGASHRRERLFILAVADPARERGQESVSPDAARGGGSPDAGGDVDDTAGARRGEGRPGAGAPLRHAARGGKPNRRRDGLPAFPPRPDERAAWERIARRRPDLIPAAQPAFHRVVDGSADWLVRAERLRLLGNAVVPAQGAAAFAELAAALGWSWGDDDR